MSLLLQSRERHFQLGTNTERKADTYNTQLQIAIVAPSEYQWAARRAKQIHMPHNMAF